MAGESPLRIGITFNAVGGLDPFCDFLHQVAENN